MLCGDLNGKKIQKGGDIRLYMELPWWLSGRESSCKAGDLGWKDPVEKEMATHSSILNCEIPGKRNLAGYSPWRCKRFGHDLAAKYIYTYS